MFTSDLNTVKVSLCLISRKTIVLDQFSFNHNVLTRFVAITHVLHVLLLNNIN